jgi:hypothetical protein
MLAAKIGWERELRRAAEDRSGGDRLRSLVQRIAEKISTCWRRWD